MNTPAHDYRPAQRTRLPQGSLLETRLRRDGKRASLSLDGIILELGTLAKIARRYDALTQLGVK